MPSRLAVVRAVAASLGGARTETEVADAVLHAVSEHLGAVTAALWLLAPAGDELVLAHEHNADPAAVARFARIPVDADVPGTHVVRTGQPIFVRSQRERDERWPAVAGTPSPSEALAILPLAATGEALGAVSFGFPDERDFDDQDELALLAVADQCAIALDRARLYQRARGEAEANELLARVSGAGLATGWVDVARSIVEACVDGFVDSCAVYVREGGVIRRVAVASRSDPDVAAALVDRFPTALSSPAAHAVVLRTGLPVHIPAGSEHEPGSPSTEYRELLARVQVGDVWVVPLAHRGRPFGAMAFAAPFGTALAEDDRELAGEVARRTASLLRSATEFAEHRAAVERLHDVLLPAAPPVIDGFDVAACYVPYAAGPDLGGDWWDVLTLPDGTVALSVGDVVGHGVPAITLMGQLRNTARSRLVAGVDPADVLDELSTLLDWTAPGAHATAVLAVADPRTGTLAWSCAGHPPPLVVDADGSAAYLEAPAAPPLGVRPRNRPAPYRGERTELRPGAAVHLFTDGLVEGRQRPIDAGLEQLARAAAAADAGSLQVRCEELVATMVDRPEDDVCLVIARRAAGTEGAERARA